MERLNPKKLHVVYSADTRPEHMDLPRRYTLTHSDLTGHLFLTIGDDYDRKQISGLYTKFMRDEVLAELVRNDDRLELRVYCHVSGGLVAGRARGRYNIFRSELPLVLEAIRYGDRTLFERHPELDSAPVLVHFESTDSRFDKVEDWGTMLQYR
ncbi:MAG: staygreen family protein [Dehalococcoidia bacterium]